MGWHAIWQVYQLQRQFTPAHRAKQGAAVLASVKVASSPSSPCSDSLPLVAVRACGWLWALS